MAELTQEEKDALAQIEKDKAKAQRQQAKELIKEAFGEYVKENAPKKRTQEPQQGFLSSLFGIH